MRQGSGRPHGLAPWQLPDVSVHLWMQGPGCRNLFCRHFLT